MSVENLTDNIQSQYGKCSVKCLEKALAKGIAGKCIVNGEAANTYTLSTDKRKAFRRKKRASQRKPKALTAYNLYVQHEIRKRRTDKQKVTALMKEIARDWKKLTPSEKTRFQQLAEEVNTLARQGQ
tara:strand:+ start:152 stop:532 length:381 start_codon:yes stop_codon:yes gene_type:complete